MRPFKPRMGRKMTILVAIFIWILSFSIALPELLFYTTKVTEDGSQIVCAKELSPSSDLA